MSLGNHIVATLEMRGNSGYHTQRHNCYQTNQCELHTLCHLST